MGNTGEEIDQTTKQKIIYQIGLMLRRKPNPFIVEFIGKEWGIKKSQAYNYIRLAKKDWEKYFSQVKRCGKNYHVAQLRDLKDQAYDRKVVIGSGENKEVITIADLRLILEIAKEEAKLMGIYPADKHELTGKDGEPVLFKFIIERNNDNEGSKNKINT